MFFVCFFFFFVDAISFIAHLVIGPIALLPARLLVRLMLFAWYVRL